MDHAADTYWIHDETGSYCVRNAEAYAEYVEMMDYEEPDEDEGYDDAHGPHKDHHYWE